MRFAIVLLLSAGLHAAVIKLYLKDGTYQLAREYKVNQDRVSFYSTDRGEWEDIPIELVDLKKTEAEIKRNEETLKAEATAESEEENAERAARREIRRVPMNPGAYLVNGDKIEPLPQGESKIVNNKRRSLLKAVSPIPMVSGKATVELDGAHAKTATADRTPEFYIRLSEEERFGIAKLADHNGNRVLEKLTIMPVTKEVVEEPDIVPTYHKQAADMLYKIWPEKPLEPGEYAVVEYTEGKTNMQCWDFSVKN